jgi:biopolymer transport protein TolR
MLKTSEKADMRAIAEINVTPLVDVSLVLVIIFMVTVPMLFQPMVEMLVPKAYTGTEQNRQVIFVNVTSEKKIYLDSDLVDIQALSEKLTQRLLKSSEKVVIIRADERLPYEQIKQIVGIVKKDGAKKVMFATEVKRR